MTINQKVWLISLTILMVCILLAIVIYLYTGNIIIAIFVAPPIFHWILRKRMEDKR